MASATLLPLSDRDRSGERSGKVGEDRGFSGNRTPADHLMSMGGRDDDVVDHLDIERSANLVEMPRHENIFIARVRIAARMIVDEDDARSIMLQGAPENGSRMDRELAQAPSLQSARPRSAGKPCRGRGYVMSRLRAIPLTR